jgi:hypothetical protein
MVNTSEESKLMNVQTVDSASMRYQKYIQSMSDVQDMVQAVASSHLAWVSMIVDAQKSALDLFKTNLAGSVQSMVLSQMANASARYLLQAAQGWWPD